MTFHPFPSNDVFSCLSSSLFSVHVHWYFIMLQLLPRFSSPSTWLLCYINIFCEMALISVVSWFSIMLHDLLNHIIYGLCCHFFFLIFLVNKDTFLKSDSLFCLSTLKNIHSLSTSEPSITLTILLVIFISLCWYNQKLTRDTLNTLMQNKEENSLNNFK